MNIMIIGGYGQVGKRVVEKLSKIEVEKPKKGDFFRSIKLIGIAYIFTIFVYIILKIVNGGLETELLKNEREIMSPIMLAICGIMIGVRSGFGEELLFRGVIGNTLLKKCGILKGNILQAFIFAVPHIITFITTPSLECVLLLANAFIIGLAMGYATYKNEGRIVAPMIFHGIINIMAIPIMWYLM